MHGLDTCIICIYAYNFVTDILCTVHILYIYLYTSTCFARLCILCNLLCVGMYAYLCNKYVGMC